MPRISQLATTANVGFVPVVDGGVTKKLALGTAAVATIGTSGATVPLNNTANTASAIQTIMGSATPLVVANGLTGSSTLNANIEYKGDDGSIWAGRATNAVWGVGSSSSLHSAGNRWLSVTATGVTAPAYSVGANQVVGARGAAVADASGGATIDTQARTQLNLLLARMRAHGLIAP